METGGKVTDLQKACPGREKWVGGSGMKWWILSIRNKKHGRRCMVVSGWHYLPVNSLAMNVDTGHLKHGCLIHLTMKPFSRYACHLIKAAASIISGLLHTKSGSKHGFAFFSTIPSRAVFHYCIHCFISR